MYDMLYTIVTGCMGCVKFNITLNQKILATILILAQFFTEKLFINKYLWFISDHGRQDIIHDNDIRSPNGGNVHIFQLHIIIGNALKCHDDRSISSQVIGYSYDFRSGGCRHL
jgi:hypothetical protein